MKDHPESFKKINIKTHSMFFFINTILNILLNFHGILKMYCHNDNFNDKVNINFSLINCYKKHYIFLIFILMITTLKVFGTIRLIRIYMISFITNITSIWISLKINIFFIFFTFSNNFKYLLYKWLYYIINNQFHKEGNQYHC